MANKYTDDMEVTLSEFGDKYEGEIPYNDVSQFVEDFGEEFDVDFNQRSIGGKLRYMGYTLEKKGSSSAVKKYTDEEEATIREMCSDPDNLPSQEEVAEAVGKDCKSIGGKLVSMNIYNVKKANPKSGSAVKLFTEDDEVTILEMTAGIVDGAQVFVEDIAEALGKEVKQLRGKLAGMRVKGVLTRNKAVKAVKVYTDEVLESIKGMLDTGCSLEEIAETKGLKLTGLKSILAKKGLISKSTKGKFWTDERVATLTEAVEEGQSRDDIAALLDTTVAVVGKKAKALDLEFVKAED